MRENAEHLEELENFRENAKGEARDRIELATRDLNRALIDETEWQRRVAQALADAYLRYDDPRWQSGFDGDATLWREARSLVLDAVTRDGTLLDIGCANGHLMESLELWARERGKALTVYGLEINPNLADAARRRLPAFATRIFTGNVSDWTPPRLFTYVRTGLEYVPPGQEPSLVRRVLDRFVEPGGRVIVGPVNDSALDETLRAFRAANAAPPGVGSSTDHNGKVRHVVWTAREKS